MTSHCGSSLAICTWQPITPPGDQTENFASQHHRPCFGLKKWLERLWWLVTHTDKSPVAVTLMGGALDLLWAPSWLPVYSAWCVNHRSWPPWQNCSISPIHAEPPPTTTTNWLKSKSKPLTVQKDWQGLSVSKRRSTWKCHEPAFYRLARGDRQKWLQKIFNNKY